jgi:hypothetical protein
MDRNLTTFNKQTIASLSKEQQDEILHREKEFEKGKIKSRPWTELKLKFIRVR